MDVTIKVPAIEKLLEFTASGVGSVAGPMLAPWKAGREAKAQLIVARAEVEKQQILAEGRANTTQIITKALADAKSQLVSDDASVQGDVILGELVSQRIQFQEEKRQANIGAVVRQAVLELGDKEIQDHEVDHDWTARFFGNVQDVSTEELQSLWAKALAGEVESPGSTSLRTLRILKDLDQSTAALFRTLCSARIAFQIGQIGGVPKDFGNQIVVSIGGRAARNSLQDFGLSFNSLNVLNEYGLIIPEYDSSVDQTIITDVSNSDGSLHSSSMAFRFQGRTWVMIPTDQRQGVQNVEFIGIILTKSGMELAKVVELQSMPEYEEAVVDYFQQSGFRMAEVNPHTLQTL